MEALRALSVKQPWAHAIVHLGKDVENRTRCNSHRGLLLIHASASMTPDYYAEAGGFIDRVRSRLGIIPRLPRPSLIERGGIVGIVEVVDCVHESSSPWWMGPRGLVLRNARPLPFIPCKGTVTPLFWIPDADVQGKVAEALRA
jgi:hypothetical protein